MKELITMTLTCLRDDVSTLHLAMCSVCSRVSWCAVTTFALLLPSEDMVGHHNIHCITLVQAGYSSGGTSDSGLVLMEPLRN